MRLKLSTDTAAGCSSRRRSHGFVRGMSRLCGCIHQAPRRWPLSHQESRPQLRVAGAPQPRFRSEGIAVTVSVRLQPQLYWPGATYGWSIWLVCSVPLVWSICWSVCWLVYWFGWSGVWGLLVSSVLEVWAGGWSVWLVWSVYCCVCRPVGLGHDRRDSWRFSNWQ